MITKKILRLMSLLFSIFLLIIAVIIAISPIKGLCLAQIDRVFDYRIKKVNINDGFGKEIFNNPKYNIEARFSPDFITIKCTLEFDVEKEFNGFQSLVLHEDFKFDSVKYNEENVGFEPWFSYGHAKFWKINLPELKKGDKVQLFFIYSGKTPVDKDYYLYSSEYFWYPQPPGMTESEITLRCIIDKDWEPYFSGFSTPVIELKEDVKLHEYFVSHPFSLVLINKDIGRIIEDKDDKEHKFSFWSNRAIAGGPFSSLQKVIMDLNTYYSAQIGELPDKNRYFLFTDKANEQTQADLYSVVVKLTKEDYSEEGSGRELNPDLLSQLSCGLSRVWWGGVIRPGSDGGDSLIKGLAVYSAYMAAYDLFSPELAAGFKEEWYEKYLWAKKRFIWYEKPLFEIIPIIDWQKELTEYKAPLVIHALRYLTGEQNFLKIVRKLYADYSDRPVTIEDFKGIAQEISGLDLEWFFDYFFYNSFRLDLGIESCETVHEDDEYQTTISISDKNNRFEGRVDLLLSTGKEIIHKEVDFIGSSGKVIIRTGNPVEWVQLDPEAWWPDVNRENNYWGQLPAME